MPKAEAGSLKDIGKRIKAKGLQKLKFWCEMCSKQCRDANGFKCHLTSESHLRQMKLFSQNANSIMDRKSKEFEKTFLDNLRMRHSTAKVNANNVYQEVIADKMHVHMNATMWTSLGDFCKYLGKTGKCVVEETERGWFISYIERDVMKLEQEEQTRKRLAAEQEAEKIMQEQLENQRIEAAKALDRAGGVLRVEATKIEEGQTPVQVALQKTKKRKTTHTTTVPSIFQEEDDDEEEEEQPPKAPEPPKLKVPALVESRKQSSSSKATWITPNILVRLVNKKMNDGKFFRRKAIIDKVKDGVATVTILDSGPDANDGGDVLELKEKDLETVIPKQLGKRVKILRGEHRGKIATLEDTDKKKYRGVLKLEDGTILKKVDYDDFSKAA